MGEYLIYKHTSPNGKSYIGQTKDYQLRCRDHKKGNNCTAFANAIKKYGWDNFTHEILKDDLTLEEANHWETFYIKYFNTIKPNGYNLKHGGLNGAYSEDSKKKMSASAKGRTSWNAGLKLSEEHKKKLSQARKGKEPANKGTKFSDEHRLKLSIARKKRVTSEETKAKMSASLKGKKRTPEQLLNYKKAQQKRFAHLKGVTYDNTIGN